MKLSIPSLLAFLCCCLATDSAYAQRANRTSTSSTATGSSNFPTSNIDNIGSSSQIGSNGANSGFSQTQQNGRVGMRNANQNLVGTNNFGQGAGQNTGRRNQGGGGAGNSQNFGTGMNPYGQQIFGNQNFGNFGQNSMQAKRTIQPQHRVAFSYPLPTTANVSGKLEKILAPHPKAKVQVRNLNIVSGEEGLVTLRGEVESEEYKQLAGMMVQFEPGVRRVQNELVVRTDGQQ